MTSLGLTAAALWGLAAGGLGWAATRPRRGGDPDPARRAAVERADWVFRHLGGWADAVAAAVPPDAAAAADVDLRVADVAVPYTGAEFLARGQVAGRVLGAAAAAVFGLLAGWPGVAAGLALAWWLPGASRRGLGQRAQARLARIRARIPLAIDLIAAQLVAGSQPAVALRTTAAEFGAHPAGEELWRITRAADGGQSLAAAALGSAVFRADPDLRQIAAELARGEELGVELENTFRTIGRQLHARDRSRAERRAEEARTRLSGPALLISGACLVVMIVPFLLHMAAQYR